MSEIFELAKEITSVSQQGYKLGYDVGFNEGYAKGRKEAFTEVEKILYPIKKESEYANSKM